jgi:predicted transposase/invertase (TIGR01784 family)
LTLPTAATPARDNCHLIFITGETRTMHSRYVDPKNDLAFKRVFGERADLLMSFLNALLPLPDDAPIESLEYLTPEQVPELPGLLKNSIVDVKCRDVRGRTFIVEMQMLWQTSFEHRIVFAASQAYVKQLESGASYDSLQPVYALALVNKVFDRKTPQYHHHYRIVHVDQPERVLEGLEFVFVEIPKFKLNTPTKKRMAVMWMRFLSEVGNDHQDVDPELQNDPLISAALHLVEVSKFTRAELELYHEREDQTRVEMLVLKNIRNEGKAEGRAEGLAEGEAKITQMLKATHAGGMSPEAISQITGHALPDVLGRLV